MSFAMWLQCCELYQSYLKNISNEDNLFGTEVTDENEQRLVHPFPPAH